MIIALWQDHASNRAPRQNSDHSKHEIKSLKWSRVQHTSCTRWKCVGMVDDKDSMQGQTSYMQ